MLQVRSTIGAAARKIRDRMHTLCPDLQYQIYWLAICFVTVLVRITYRHVEIRGLENIPDKGGVIIAAAPHQNQMVDPGIIMEVVYWKKNRRTVSNIIPRVWMRTRFIGSLAKALLTIPLDRPNDYRRLGPGKIYPSQSEKGSIVLSGHCTRFGQDTAIADNYIIILNDAGHSAMAKIKSVLSDKAVELYTDFAPASVAREIFTTRPSGFQYWIAPKLDRSPLYSRLIDLLTKGNGLLVFPEGSSHDTPGLLPFQSQ
jgi:glycerol-3-phosphate O-acyltransferase / dihydroxyacetone phosphate acyltransferase